jgi:hypothetical protein
LKACRQLQGWRMMSRLLAGVLIMMMQRCVCRVCCLQSSHSMAILYGLKTLKLLRSSLHATCCATYMTTRQVDADLTHMACTSCQ